MAKIEPRTCQTETATAAARMTATAMLPSLPRARNSRPNATPSATSGVA